MYFRLEVVDSILLLDVDKIGSFEDIVENASFIILKWLIILNIFQLKQFIMFNHGTVQ